MGPNSGHHYEQLLLRGAGLLGAGRGAEAEAGAGGLELLGSRSRSRGRPRGRVPRNQRLVEDLGQLGEGFGGEELRRDAVAATELRPLLEGAAFVLTKAVPRGLSQGGLPLPPSGPPSAPTAP